MKHTLDRIISCAILKRKKKGKEASNRFIFQLHYENTDKQLTNTKSDCLRSLNDTSSSTSLGGRHASNLDRD